MTYDLDQEYSNGKSGYNAALYPHTTSPTNQDYSIEQSMMYLHGTRFIPYSKLVLGVPFYGKYFLGAANINSLYISALPVAYYQIMNLNGWTRIWDDTAKVPYLMNGSSVITYDDSMSIAFKCQYAKTKGLSGIMIWELSQDVIGQTQPLLDVVSNQVLTSVKDNVQLQNILVNKFTLYNNYPNPFNPTTTIRFYLPISSFMTLKVYDVLGREVATLAHEERSSGEGFVIFDASTYGLSSGVYFYRMQAGMYSETKRLVLMK
jgi:GH18 family chitinase